MYLARYFVYSALACALFFSATWAGSAATPRFSNALNGGSGAFQGSAPRHLYVVDGYGINLYRFPLAKDGLPESTPDAQLAMNFGIVAVAIGPNGETYVENVIDQTISVFPAHFSSSSKPKRVLNVTVGEPSWIAVDTGGRLLVAVIGSFDVNTVVAYAPGARGNATPIWTMHFPRFTQIDAITSDDQDRFVMQFVNDTIETASMRSAAAPLQMIPNVRSEGAEDGVTLDAGEVYFTDELTWTHNVDVIAVGAAPARAFGHVNVDRVIYADDCQGRIFSGFDPISYGIAVHDKWLFLGCQTGLPAGATGVQVYDALRGGHQKPRLILRTSEFTTAAGIALGP